MSTTSVLRPTGDGYYTDWNIIYPSSPTTRYDKVDEETADDDATYICVQGTYPSAYMLTTFTKGSITSGTPLKVAIVMRGKTITSATDMYVKGVLRLGSNNHVLGNNNFPSGVYGQIDYVWPTNPFTNKSWTLDEINGLEFGLCFELVYGSSRSFDIRCTQIWLEVEMADNTVAATDAGAGADTLALLTGNMTIPDPGTGSEALALSSSFAVADAGTGVDTGGGGPFVADAGTNQQEAVGMGAVHDPRFEGATVNATLPVSDAGIGIEQISGILATFAVSDVGTGTENITSTASFLILDDGHGNESIILTANIPVIDTGQGVETINPISASLTVNDSCRGTDTPALAKTFFLIDHYGVLHPLGVFVLRDSRQDLLPGTRENTEEIPGRHGEIDFGSELRPRLLELQVSTQEFDPSQREQIKRAVAKWLNPLLGAQNLIFADDIEKTYRVKYAGKIDLSRMFPNWLEFTIPFKVSDPFIIATWEKHQTGSGTLTNEGTVETPLIIEIIGPVTNPSVVVGEQTLSYAGSLAAGDKLVIDTEKMTVTLNGINALGSYSGGFPKLQPGDTTVTAAAGGTTIFRWRDRWI